MGRHGTIAGRKSAQDARRAAMFTKYTRQIIVATKEGGDPEFNSSLRVAIDKAKAIGMPNDNISRAIKKGTGELAGESYEELVFEGYGPSGVAVIVEALTDLSLIHILMGLCLKTTERSMLMLQFLNLFLPMMPSECTSRRSERYRC